MAPGAHKAATKIITSEELRTDEAIDVDAYLASEFGGRIGALAENAFTLGDGSGKPPGLVTAGNGITVVTAATGSATSYKLADLKTVYKTLPQAYRRTASWLIGGDDFAELGRWPTALARLCCRAFSSTRQASSAAPCSSPVTCPRPAANAKSLVFGDFKLGYGVRRVRNALDSAGRDPFRPGPSGLPNVRPPRQPAAAHRCASHPRPLGYVNEQRTHA